RPRASSINTKSDPLNLSTTIAKTIQPFKGLFSPKTRKVNARQESQLLRGQNIIIMEPNGQDATFGESTSLHGQLACVWILA
ncbi:unnamed protein product, partial [Rotaria magnacalcarata]